MEWYNIKQMKKKYRQQVMEKWGEGQSTMLNASQGEVIEAQKKLFEFNRLLGTKSQ